MSDWGEVLKFVSMRCYTQNGYALAIHLDSIIYVGTGMHIRFRDRAALLDEKASEFLVKVAYLGGYATADQAKRMSLASSPTRVLVRLHDLERSGFLRRVVEQPLVYQITTSVTRLVGVDMTARRPRPVATVRWRLLCLNFYLEASTWPADFIFDNDEKIVAFAKLGCPRQLLPQRGGQPYLWDYFVLDSKDGRLCVSAVDRADSNAFRQTFTLLRRFADCRQRVRERLSLVVAVGSNARERLYAKAARHPKLHKYAPGTTEAVATYQVITRVSHIRALTHEANTHTEDWIRGGYENQ